MKHLYNHLSNILSVAAGVVLAILLVGASVIWLMIGSILAIDFATFMWLNRQHGGGGGKRYQLAPTLTLNLLPT